MYAISKLINRVISGNKELKREVVLRLGYRNLDKGYRRLDHLIETGECPEPMKKMLPRALGVDLKIVEEAFGATAGQKEEELVLARRCREEYERRIFKPHLWIEHKLSRPKSITIVVFTGVDNYKVVRIPEDINKLGWDEQIGVVREAIQRHQQDEGIEDYMFRKVTGYVYRQTYDDSHLFSKDGNIIEKNIGRLNKAEASLRIGNKEISGGMIKMILNHPGPPGL